MTADGAAVPAPATTPKMVDVFSDIERDTALKANPAGYAVTELAAQDPRVLTLTADLSNTLAEFREKFPGRYIELGIAETNSVSFAAGLAACGFVPYIYSMAPFGILKTAEQLRTDVDYNHLPVRLVGRLAGLAMGYFGTSHYAVEDIAIARTLNNTVVVAPADAASTVALMRLIATLDAPAYIRIAEAPEPVYSDPPAYEAREVAPAGRGRRRHDRRARHGRGAGAAGGGGAARAGRHRGRRTGRRFPQAIRRRRADRERHQDREGAHRRGPQRGRRLGSLVAETVARHRLAVELAQVALPATDLEVGVPAELYEYYGLTPPGVAAAARELVKR